MQELSRTRETIRRRNPGRLKPMAPEIKGVDWGPAPPTNLRIKPSIEIFKGKHAERMEAKVELLEFAFCIPYGKGTIEERMELCATIGAADNV